MVKLVRFVSSLAFIVRKSENLKNLFNIQTCRNRSDSLELEKKETQL